MSLPRRLAASTRSGAVGLHQAHDAEARSEALLGMRLGVHDRFDQRDGCRADRGGFAHHRCRRPFRVAAVGAWHVLGDGRVSVAHGRERMARNPLALMEDLDRLAVIRTSTISRISREGTE